MKNKKQYEILEFNGLPGSGKSTITSKLINEFKLENKVVLSEKDIFVQTKTLMKMLEFAKGFFDVRSAKLNCALLTIGIKASIKSRKFNNIQNAIKMVRYSFLLRERTSNIRFDVICLSEGLMQFIYCMYDGVEFFKSNELEILICEINKLHKNLLMINCYISKDEALRRLRTRALKSNTIDLLSEKEQVEFLELRNRNMKKIRECTQYTFDSFEINGLEDVEKNVSDVLSISKSR